MQLERSDSLTTLGQLASVDVGVVTGRNDFFVLTPARAVLELRDRCLPLVGRSAQIPGLVLGAEEWAALAEADGRCLLLQLGRTGRDDLTPAARAYVEQGEAAGFHTGDKCRSASPTWWHVPSTSVPDAFLLRQIHDGPRIVANHAGATSTDTIHRVRVAPGVDAGWLAAASMNSLTWAFAEIRGRSYGGGVLELEPNEADALPFPSPIPGRDLPVADLDLWMRRKAIDDVLDEVDAQVLAAAGLTSAERVLVRGVWPRLASRRRSRTRRGGRSTSSAKKRAILGHRLGMRRRTGSPKTTSEMLPNRSKVTAFSVRLSTVARPMMKNQPSVTIVTPTAP